MSLPPNLSGAELSAWLQAEVERHEDARLSEDAKKIAAIRSNPPVVPIPTVLPLSGESIKWSQKVRQSSKFGNLWACLRGRLRRFPACRSQVELKSLRQ